jgi:polyvinyl alcohol dehydrogenase (cytochrome)
VPARPYAACAALAALLIAPVARSAPEGARPESNLCSDPSEPLALGSAQWNGWGRDIENTRYQPEPAIRATDVPKLRLRWSYGFQGSAVAGQPTVVDGRLFVLSAAGRVYSLDAKTGCTYWTYDAASGTHSSIFIGELGPSRKAAAPPPERQPRSKSRNKARKAKHQLIDAHLDVLKAPSAAFFGDDRGALYALDAQKGTLLWKTQVDSHPLARISAAPVLFHERLYAVVNSSEQSAAQSATYSAAASPRSTC